jgi:predicted Zn-dependent peptidase
LNGLPVVYWQRPGDANLFMKLRLNSGAAFDLTGKAGTMALLGDALFPDPATREYVTEELGGHLEVTTTYDSIDVTISGKASQAERMIELLRNAILGMNLSADSVSKLREARIAQLGKAPLSNSVLADRAVATRLFGTFPYGRPAGETLEFAES